MNFSLEKNHHFFFQLNTITKATLPLFPTTVACATAGTCTVQELEAALIAAQTAVNTNIVTPFNNYGNPTC